ncbi:MAG: hypothetical protein KJO08_00960, partial [Gammaproteobacteria bacterium]|nr:hypothetical protein [Gammaproteobacteria bacterium]
MGTPPRGRPIQQVSVRNEKKPVGSGERRLARETEPTTTAAQRPDKISHSKILLERKLTGHTIWVN